MSEYNIQMNKYNALNAGYDQLYPATKIKNVDGLDTALQSKPNPNLLDNWYFSNPVDQRGGYVYPPNSPYADRSGNQIGTASKYLTIDKSKKSPFSADWAEISIDGTTYYGYIPYAVRGYTGSGYGLDRWFCNGITLLSDGHLSIKHNGGFHQKIENFRFVPGATYTLSYLTAEGVLRSASGVVDNVTETWQIGKWQDGYFFGLGFNPSESFHTVTIGANAGDLNIVAAKLELGSQQTLAHQDENGNWVLNEIPDYGEQLARCQGYLLDSRESGSENSYSGIATETWLLVTNVVFPEVMREIPGVKLYNHSAVDHVRRIVDNEDLSLPSSMVINRTKNGVIFIYEPSHANTFIKGAAYDFNVVANAEL